MMLRSIKRSENVQSRRLLFFANRYMTYCMTDVVKDHFGMRLDNEKSGVRRTDTYHFFNLIVFFLLILLYLTMITDI